MVIAGADVGVAAQAVVILADDKNHLAVGLESNHSVGDVDTGLFQETGPANVRLFVEAGLEFEHHRHLFAVAGGIDQIFDHP